MGVNSLPKTVTRQRRGCDLNPGPSASESRTLTTRLPSHPNLSLHSVKSNTALIVGERVAEARRSAPMTRRAPVQPASRRVERRTPTSRPTCRTADTARSDNDQQTKLHYTYGDQGLNWGAGGGSHRISDPAPLI